MGAIPLLYCLRYLVLENLYQEVKTVLLKPLTPQLAHGGICKAHCSQSDVCLTLKETVQAMSAILLDTHPWQDTPQDTRVT